MPTITGVDVYPAVIKSLTTDQTMPLNPQIAYSFAHDGEDDAGAANDSPIYLAFSDSVTADAAMGYNKAKLLSGRSIPIRKGVKQVTFRSPAGTPTFTVVPLND